MERHHLLYLLAFSLSLNLGALDTLAFLHFGRGQESGGLKAHPVPPSDVWRPLHLSPGQRQAVEGLLGAHRRRMRELQSLIAREREQLLAIIRRGEPAWPEVQARVRSINDRQAELEEAVVVLFLETQKHFTPEQRRAFGKILEARVPAR